MGNFGKNIGEASAKVLLGSYLQGIIKPEMHLTPMINPMAEKAEMPKLSKEDYAHIIKGMYEAFGGHLDILALLICIQDEDKALMAAIGGVEVLEQAIGEWKSGDKGDAIGDMIGAVLIEL